MADGRIDPPHTENCLICGRELIYAAEATSLNCAYCGKGRLTDVYCAGGHYVCDDCHRHDAITVLRDVLSAAATDNPLQLLELVMRHPRVPMHGPEHHAIVPAVLVAAARHAGHEVGETTLEKAIRRGSEIPGGWCGSHGSCGAGIGVGIAVSLLTGATPLTGIPRGLAGEATAFVLGRLTDGFPRCCKRASRTAVTAGVEFIRERLGIPLTAGGPVPCRDMARNRECVLAECPYYAPDV
jgi:hypothetical protein